MNIQLLSILADSIYEDVKQCVAGDNVDEEAEIVQET